MPKIMDKETGREILLDIRDSISYCRIPFFLVMGTALGAYRDHGFVPNEKDIDVGILYEHFQSKYALLVQELERVGFTCRQASKPFDSVRGIKAKRDDIKVDIVTYVPWKDKRFCANGDPALSYAIVHDRSQLETYEEVIVFNRSFLVPSPIERYLELEYGSDWRTPKNDSKSRTRVKNFVEKNKIPHDYLRRFQTPAVSDSVGSSLR